MKFWTLAEIRTKIEEDLDLEEEQFLHSTELLGYINEGIDTAEAMIHTLYEDYFLSRSQVSLVSGTDEYALPADIYAQKIRRVVFDDGSRVYTVARVKDWRKFEQYAIDKNYGQGEIYSYFLINSVPGAPKILLLPKSRHTGSYLTLWYLRNANRLALSTDICDIPEFVHFVIQYAKVRVYEKEGHPNLQGAMAAMAAISEQMEGTLAAMTPDADNEIEMDTTHYEEHN